MNMKQASGVLALVAVVMMIAAAMPALDADSNQLSIEYVHYNVFDDNNFLTVELNGAPTHSMAVVIYDKDGKSVFSPGQEVLYKEAKFKFNLDSEGFEKALPAIKAGGASIEFLHDGMVIMSKEIGCKVTFVNGDSTTYGQYSIGSDSAELPKPTADKRTFDCWCIDSQLTEPIKGKLTKSITIYAKWHYTITYENNGGTGESKKQDCDLDKDVTFLTEAQSGFTKAGFDLIGWTDSKGNKYELGGSHEAFNEDLTLKAAWSQNNYTITYDSNGGSGASKTQSAPYGEEVTLFTAEQSGFTKAGFALTGWTDASGKSYGLGSKCAAFDKDVTLKAVWSKNYYTITYVPGEGSGSEKTQKAPCGEEVTLFTAEQSGFTKEHFSLVGWKDASGKSYGLGSKCAAFDKDVTLSAEWTNNYYTITYRSGDGSEKTQSAPYGEEVTLFTAEQSGFTKEHFSLVGWKDTSGKTYGLGVKFASFDKDVILIAVWSKNNYTITYGPGEGSGSEKTQSAPYGEEVTLFTAEQSGFTKAGFTLVEWKDTSGRTYEVGSKCVAFDKDVTLKAVWSQNYYTITYKPGEGTGEVKAQVVPYGEDVTLFTADQAEFNKECFTPVEWKDASGKSYGLGSKCAAFDKDVTLMAVWTQIEYRIIYDPNGGDGVQWKQIAAIGEKVTLYTLNDTAYTKDGYKLIGWKDASGKSYDLGGQYDAFDKDMTMNAVWTDYKITYKPGEGTGSEKTQTAFYGKSITLFTAEQSGFSKDRYTMVGWKDVSGKIYNLGGQYDAFDQDVALVAIWSQNTYTITYGPGDGTGEAKSQKVPVGEKVTLYSDSESGFTKDGYKLKGWIDGSGKAYDLGGQYDAFDKDITLKAVWTDYTLTYEPNGGEGTTNTQKALYGKNVTLLTAEQSGFTKEGYNLTGWKDEQGRVFELGKQYDAFDKDTTFLAVWTEFGEFSITVQDDGNGSAEASVYLADVGGTVRLTSTPDDGYRFSNWEIIKGNITISDDGYFVMPSSNVSVKAHFVSVVFEPIEKESDKGSISIPADVAKKMGIESEDQVELFVVKIDNPPQGNIPKDAIVYDVKLTLNGEEVHKFSGEVSILLYYEGDDWEDYNVYYVSDSGEIVEPEASYYSSMKGFVVKINHLSNYVLSKKEIEPAAPQSDNGLMVIIGIVVIALVLIMVALFFILRKRNNNQIQ